MLHSCADFRGLLIETSSIHRVATAGIPLKFLKEGHPDRAKQHLEQELHEALENINLMTTMLHRPDMLTNPVVVYARTLEKN